jgi:hypothetical protein
LAILLGKRLPTDRRPKMTGGFMGIRNCLKSYWCYWTIAIAFLAPTFTVATSVGATKSSGLQLGLASKPQMKSDFETDLSKNAPQEFALPPEENTKSASKKNTETDPFLAAIDEAVAKNPSSVKYESRSAAPVANTRKSSATDDSEALSAKTQMASLDKEVSEAESDGYDQCVKESRREQSQLKRELARLDHDVTRAKNGTERSKARAAIEEKKLDFQKHRLAEKTANLKFAEARKKADQKALERLKTKVEVTEKKVLAVKARKAKTEKALLAIQKERESLKKRLKKAQTKVS